MDKKNIRIVINNSNHKTIINNYNNIKYDDEIWKHSRTVINAEVSNKGNIRDNITKKPYRLYKVGNYLKVQFNGKQYFLHKLIAEAFIPNPDNKPHVDHIDTNPINNVVENLRWCTVKENNNNPRTVDKQIDRLKNYNKDRKLKVIRINPSTNEQILFNSILDAANSVNDASTNISRVCKANFELEKPRYKCKGYYFVYANLVNMNGVLLKL